MPMTCDSCGVIGLLNAEEAIQEEVRLLAEDDDGSLLCLPCYMRRENVCHNCSDVVDYLLPNVKCTSEPWICEDCYYNIPYTVHMFACYSNGCMSPEEFAQECYREVLADVEEEQDVY